MYICMSPHHDKTAEAIRPKIRIEFGDLSLSRDGLWIFFIDSMEFITDKMSSFIELSDFFSTFTDLLRGISYINKKNQYVAIIKTTINKNFR